MGVSSLTPTLLSTLVKVAAGAVAGTNLSGLAALTRWASEKLPALNLASTPEIASLLPRVVIIGEGGGGKSTILKQMLALCAQRGRVPVWVPLSALPLDGKVTTARLIRFLVEQSRSALGIELDPAFFEALIQENQLAIGFDALDECGSLPRQQRARALIIEAASAWPGCQIFVTSRPEAFQETGLPLLPERGEVEKSRFSSEFLALTPRQLTIADARVFIARIFDDQDGALADKVLELTDIEAFLATPLLLMLIALQARDPEQDGATTRAGLFRRCVHTVCGSWDAAKSETSSPDTLAADGLRIDDRIELLRWIGWETQRAGKTGLDSVAAVRAVAQWAKDRHGSKDAILKGLRKRNMLLRAQSGPGPEGRLIRLDFVHPLFREYLAGAHLAQSYLKEDAETLATMASRWFDTSWLEPLRFAAASLADDFPELLDVLLADVLKAEAQGEDAEEQRVLLAARLLTAVAPVESDGIAQIVDLLGEIRGTRPDLTNSVDGMLVQLAHLPAGQDVWQSRSKDELAFDVLELAQRRRLISNDDPIWEARFRTAIAGIAALPGDAISADMTLSDAVYFAVKGIAGTGVAAWRQLLVAALPHPAFTWMVGPKLGALVPDMAPQAIDAMTSYIERGETGAIGTDFSRMNGVYAAVCGAVEDTVATPTLLRLLRIPLPEGPLRRGRPYNMRSVAESLRSRGQVAAGLEAIEARLAPAVAPPICVPEDPPQRNPFWEAAAALDPDWTRRRIELAIGKPLAATTPDLEEALASVGASAVQVELFGTAGA